MNENEINIFKCLDFIRDTAPKFAKAKSERVYLEEFRKTKKALCMRDAELKGHKSSATQEREAYANQEYIDLLEALKNAVEEEEKLKWQITAANAKIEVWRSISANERIEKKVI